MPTHVRNVTWRIVSLLLVLQSGSVRALFPQRQRAWRNASFTCGVGVVVASLVAGLPRFPLSPRPMKPRAGQAGVLLALCVCYQISRVLGREFCDQLLCAVLHGSMCLLMCAMQHGALCHLCSCPSLAVCELSSPSGSVHGTMPAFLVASVSSSLLWSRVPPASPSPLESRPWGGHSMQDAHYCWHLLRLAMLALILFCCT